MPRFWPRPKMLEAGQLERISQVISTAHRLHDRTLMPREFGDLRLMTNDRENGVAKRRGRGAKTARAGKSQRAAAARRQAEAPPESRPRRRVLAVTSGKGGVGKTNIVTNLAIALARQGARV